MFSGYIAADELDDGPFGVLSIVDNRTCKWRSDKVLDQDPTHADIQTFFQRFPATRQQRGLTVRAITTDASPLYPEPIAQVCGTISHQLCAFHIRIMPGSGARVSEMGYACTPGELRHAAL